MSESFPLRPDADWYSVLVSRFGDAVPAIENLRIRRGLQPPVFDLFMQLSDLGLLQHVYILSIVTRSAAFTVIDARYKSGIAEDNRIALDFALEVAQERMAAACEHCGRYGHIILKIGMEAQPEDPDMQLGNHLLCAECNESWRSS